MEIDTNLVRIGDRIRGTDAKRVAKLTDSIKEVGLINPITVRPTKIVQDMEQIDGYEIVAGLHRFTACRKMNWKTIPAVIIDMDDHQRVIVECDENLCGSNLSPAEVALFTGKRKRAYEAIHGPAKAIGANAANAAQGRAHDASANLSFASDTAAKTGKSERAVQREASRGEKIAPEALEKVQGTKLDSGSYLDKLKGVEPGKQVAKIERDLAAAKPVPKAKDEGRQAFEPSPQEAQMQALLDAWADADDDVRTDFLDRIPDL